MQTWCTLLVMRQMDAAAGVALLFCAGSGVSPKRLAVRYAGAALNAKGCCSRRPAAGGAGRAANAFVRDARASGGCCRCLAEQRYARTAHFCGTCMVDMIYWLAPRC